MKDFFPIETPYNSEDYKLMQAVVNKGIDSSLEGFTKSKFGKSPNFNNKFLWNIHTSELPILYRRLQELADETGNDDYISLLDDVQNVADKSLNAIAGFGEEELDEMIDPYDPMDANQTISGFPTSTSDLNADGVDTAPAYPQGNNAFAGQAIEDYIDDDTIEQELHAENSSDSLTIAHGENLKPNTNEGDSDSLANLHGMNAKPENMIDETTDTERYEDVVYLQGEEANEVMDILNNDGRDAAMEYLKQWHDSGNHMGRNELGHGTEDKTYAKDGYIMFWNPYLPYIGLTYDTEFGLNEDSIMKRKLAGQRQKTVQLGQHAPHSQAAKK
jgi:hypothetical protein